ncbi:MAG: maleylacetoacetate isomerase [Pseudomonadota bacterium]|nr:maleylacetoacetate isomerase [Pseudomonadota bacterium]
MKFDLHNYFRSSSSYRVRIALNLKGLASNYLPVHLNRNGGEQFTPAFRALSPDAVVPVLVAGNDTLTQSLAIIEWLDETQPGAPLLPSLPAERAFVRALSQSIACEIHPLNNLRVLKYLTGVLKLDEVQKLAWVQHWTVQGMAAVEAMLAQRRDPGVFCHGAQPGLADCCLVPQAFNAERFGIDVAAYPIISSIVAACQQLPAFRDAHPGRQVDAE